MPWLLYTWRKPPPPQYPLDRRLSGPQSQSAHGSKEKNSLPLPGIESWLHGVVPFHILLCNLDRMASGSHQWQEFVDRRWKCKIRHNTFRVCMLPSGTPTSKNRIRDCSSSGIINQSGYYTNIHIDLELAMYHLWACTCIYSVHTSTI